MVGYVYVWQEAMFRNAKRHAEWEPPIIVRTPGEVYGVRIAGPSEIVYTPPDEKFKTRGDPLKNGVRVFIKLIPKLWRKTEPNGQILIRMGKTAIESNRYAY